MSRGVVLERCDDLLAVTGMQDTANTLCGVGAGLRECGHYRQGAPVWNRGPQALATMDEACQWGHVVVVTRELTISPDKAVGRMTATVLLVAKLELRGTHDGFAFPKRVSGRCQS